MAEELIFGRAEAAFLRELVRRRVDFMIVGLAAAALQGAPVVTQDIDLWFKNLRQSGIKKALTKVGGMYVPPIGLHPPCFAGNGVNLFDIVTHMHGLDSFARERRLALEVPLGRIRVPVLSLEQIIRSKKATGRDKDKLALRVLSDTLKASRTVSLPAQRAGFPKRTFI